MDRMAPSIDMMLYEFREYAMLYTRTMKTYPFP